MLPEESTREMMAALTTEVVSEVVKSSLIHLLKSKDKKNLFMD